MLEFEGRAVAEGISRDFLAAAEAAGLRPLLDRIRTGYQERTPAGGIHLLYRCPTPLPNTKLARRPATDEELLADPADKIKVLIETRGEGGYVILAPSNGRVHPTGGAWMLEAGGFATIAVISDAERDELFRLARTFDTMPTSAATEGPGRRRGRPARRPVRRRSPTSTTGRWPCSRSTAGRRSTRARASTTCVARARKRASAPRSATPVPASCTSSRPRRPSRPRATSPSASMPSSSTRATGPLPRPRWPSSRPSASSAVPRSLARDPWTDGRTPRHRPPTTACWATSPRPWSPSPRPTPSASWARC